jgi:hypothetical protein
METLWFSEISVVFYQTIRRHISEHGGLNCLLTAKKLLQFPLLSKSLKVLLRDIRSVCFHTKSVPKCLAKFPRDLSWNYAKITRTQYYLIWSHYYVCWSNAIYLIVLWVLTRCVDLAFQHKREASWKLQTVGLRWTLRNEFDLIISWQTSSKGIILT